MAKPRKKRLEPRPPIYSDGTRAFVELQRHFVYLRPNLGPGQAKFPDQDALLSLRGALPNEDCTISKAQTRALEYLAAGLNGEDEELVQGLVGLLGDVSPLIRRRKASLALPLGSRCLPSPTRIGRCTSCKGFRVGGCLFEVGHQRISIVQARHGMDCPFSTSGDPHGDVGTIEFDEVDSLCAWLREAKARGSKTWRSPWG